MKPMISFKSNWSIGKNRVESTGTVGDESQKDAQEVEEVEEEEEEGFQINKRKNFSAVWSYCHKLYTVSKIVTTTSSLRHMKICVKRKLAAEQQTRLNSLPTDLASPLVPAMNYGKVYMEQMREAPAH
ncbi:hypothetical protein M9H77_08722 [Catharanthus roseus]|uniref:Uncharacterized protein n=1 Tax=Catharanthus roseus TaxID=4058 RepID=A0ACC0BYU9_CATRO|nr:hypothetical protein M9H77_08722 [Catharanthus roseus]